MRRTTVLAGVACATLAIAAVGCGDDEEDGVSLVKKTFVYDERESQDDFAFVDNPPKTTVGREGPERLTAGDQIIFRSDMLKGGKDVGDLHARCLMVTGGRFDQAGIECTGIYTLPGGKLFAAIGGKGVFGDDSSSGTITGGTGAYAGATGIFTSPDEEDGLTRDTFTIYVPEG